MNTHRWIQSFAVVSLLSLYGCKAATEAPASNPSPAAPQATAASTSSGMVDTAIGRYTFAPSTCAIHQDGDVMDIEIDGPGTAPDGEKIFVEFSSTANALSIKLGVDTRFSSPDRTLKAGEFIGKKMQVEVSGKTIRVAELELVDRNGERQAGSLEINC